MTAPLPLADLQTHRASFQVPQCAEALHHLICPSKRAQAYQRTICPSQKDALANPKRVPQADEKATGVPRRRLQALDDSLTLASSGNPAKTQSPTTPTTTPASQPACPTAKHSLDSLP